MGDYSRDPFARLTDSVGKRYVGVRLQQGVPVLDADWNELDDLRRQELATAHAWFTGDGVPVGSDGFRLVPLPEGGVGTLVLTAGTAVAGPSVVEVDLALSTAAAALGFGPDRRLASRAGDSPARLTGLRAEPFALAAGRTLTVVVDGGPAETVTFAAGDFAAIGAATAAEVVAALNAGLNRATAAAGAGGDFLIRGRRDGLHGGSLFVGGQLTENEVDVLYSEQPLFENAALAAEWGVDVVPALAAPAGPTRFTAFLDVWHREVLPAEDAALFDPRIGVETTNRLRREWAVRVVEALDFEAANAARPPGHTFYPLAFLDRTAGPEILPEMVADLRDTDVSLRRAVAYRAPDGLVLVDSADLAALLTQTRDNVRGLASFLTTQFVNPNDGYKAGEVAGLDALSAVATVAEGGLALLHAEALGTRAALDLLGQLALAEGRLVEGWRAALFPVTKPAGTVYEQRFETMIDRIEAFLAGPAPPGFTALDDALAAGNLAEAVRTQAQINNELGEETGRPTGVLSLTYLGSVTAVIVRNVPFDLDYEVAGSVTPDDDLDVEAFVNAGWQVTFRNEDGTQPLALRLGPGEDAARFRATVRPPNVAASTTPFSLRIHARRNSGGLYHQTAQATLTIGDPPPPSEEDFSFTFIAGVPTQDGVFQVPTGAPAIVTFRLHNNTPAPRTVDLSFTPLPAAAAPWTLVQGAFALDDQIVPADTFAEFAFMFTAPAAPDNDLTFVLTARDDATAALVAQTQIALTSVAP